MNDVCIVREMFNGTPTLTISRVPIPMGTVHLSRYKARDLKGGVMG